ncbi:Spy/CpxP family protein refolding chaperone [Alteromonas sp. CI.11.F.A3]|uniref:Spy/CpxP family protein refolding chaperone n=1 Tax=Alteromonas sp. CI.11.F.A3 TaxID=3079555 RepID=UPI002943C67E|nr:Spy/CpxP family protein refolding chaperone [Alteromonas sp. CI.11.F.A3]WOI37149.1 Spy/CpxP family protein refolding chaperone [Alteromonas sp. CI.11.F.A3]
MKSILIAGLLATTFTLAHNASAAPNGPKMRDHAPGMEMIKTLSRLSLSSEQMNEVKNLVTAFKANHERPDAPPKKPEMSGFASLSESEIRSFVETRMLKQHEQHFAIAELRSQIYRLLSESQRNMLTEFDAKRETKREAAHGLKRGANRGADRSAMRGQPPRGPRLPFEELQLTDEQLTSLETLNATFRETRFQHKVTMDALKDARKALVRSGNFSESAWDALYAEYKDDLVNAAIEDITHKQATYAVLTDAQQVEMQQKRENMDALRRLFSDN